ncbi:hypothetical protein AWV80_26200 [Cupriavidus sp. UYMU48A]|nr:hypothetical protein AWV80_26200 [Cupriavidus sp. UYMU48A]
MRPEHFRLGGEQVPDGHNVLRGRIIREKFIGKVVQFDVEIGDGTMLVVDGTLAQAKGVGANANVIWDPEMTHIYPFAEDPEIGITAKKVPSKSSTSHTTVAQPASAQMSMRGV